MWWWVERVSSPMLHGGHCDVRLLVPSPPHPHVPSVPSASASIPRPRTHARQTADAVVRTDWGSLWLGTSDAAGVDALHGPLRASVRHRPTLAPLVRQPERLAVGGSSAAQGAPTAGALGADAQPRSDGPPPLDVDTDGMLPLESPTSGASPWRERVQSGASDGQLPAGLSSPVVGLYADAEDDLDIFVRISGNFHGEEVQFAVIHGAFVILATALLTITCTACGTNNAS